MPISSLQHSKMESLRSWFADESSTQWRYNQGPGQIPYLLEEMPLDQETTLDLETFPVEHDRISVRHYFLTREALPEDDEERKCIILHMLRRTQPNSYLVYAADAQDNLYVFHNIKCDQAEEAFLDDYFRMRLSVSRFIGRLPKILDEAITACSAALPKEPPL
jgi:hypothetical protein